MDVEYPTVYIMKSVNDFILKKYYLFENLEKCDPRLGLLSFKCLLSLC